MKSTGIIISVITLLLITYSISLSQSSKQYGVRQASNLGHPINSDKYADIFPSISTDGTILVFQSDREEQWKLFISKKIGERWSKPVVLDKVNASGGGLGPFLSYDGNYLLLCSSRSGGFGDMDIWISERLGDEWIKPVNIGAPINTDGYDGFASLSPDGNEIYFVRTADSPGDCIYSGTKDIYYSRKINDKWSTPKMLPFPINTDACEHYPIILADGITLIFSSTRAGGFGGYDLYKSEKLNGGKWSTPVNLGSFINTSEDEDIVSIPAAGDTMFFSSGPEDYDESNWGKNDIFSVPIPPPMQPITVITVSGTIIDGTSHKPLFAKIEITDMEDEQDTKSIMSNKADGSYIVILNKGKEYYVSVSSPNYTFHSTTFDLRELGKYKEYKRDISLYIPMDSTEFTLSLFFNIDSDVLLG